MDGVTFVCCVWPKRDDILAENWTFNFKQKILNKSTLFRSKLANVNGHNRIASHRVRFKRARINWAAKDVDTCFVNLVYIIIFSCLGRKCARNADPKPCVLWNSVQMLQYFDRQRREVRTSKVCMKIARNAIKNRGKVLNYYTRNKKQNQQQIIYESNMRARFRFLRDRILYAIIMRAISSSSPCIVCLYNAHTPIAVLVWWHNLLKY